MPCRLLWKRSIGQSKPHFAADELAELLFKTYLAIFSSEDLSSLLTGVLKADSHKLSRPSFSTNHRPSFIGLIKSFQKHTSSDWETVIKLLLSKIVHDQTLSLGSNYIQELYLYLHLCGIFTADAFLDPTAIPLPMTGVGGFSQWESMPGAICVTLKVYRPDLRPLTQYFNNPTKIGTPCLIGGLESPPEPFKHPWLSLFSAVSFCFGEVISSGDAASDGFNTQVTEDKNGWHGQSPLLMTFWAPSFVLLQDFPEARASVRIQSTPHAAGLFFKDTNDNMTIYQSHVGNTGNVFISKSPPGLQGPPRICAGPDTLSAPAVVDGSRMTLTAFLDSGTSALDHLAARVDLIDEIAIGMLQDKRIPVEKQQLSPFTLSLRIGEKTHARKFLIDLPFPMHSSRAKLRIARTSELCGDCALSCGCPLDGGIPRLPVPDNAHENGTFDLEHDLPESGPDARS